MSNYTCYVGKQIRKYRKAGKMTLQDLADAIHKSRATICKYENGEIAVDIETLYEISQVLQVSISQLTTYLPETTSELISTPGRSRKSPFFQAQRLYFYFYTGRVLYSDMLIRFSFVNQYNPLEEDLLYIFNPLELRDFTMGLLCGISSADLMPCAFKCVVTLKPQEHTENFRHQLLFTKKDLKRLEQLNMLLVENKEN